MRNAKINYVTNNRASIHRLRKTFIYLLRHHSFIFLFDISFRSNVFRDTKEMKIISNLFYFTEKYLGGQGRKDSKKNITPQTFL